MTKKWEDFVLTPRKRDALLQAVDRVREHFPAAPYVLPMHGMISWDRNMGFFENDRLMQAIRKFQHLEMMPNYHWNVSVVAWAAKRSLRVEGDFIELGVYQGYTTAVLAEYLDFGGENRRWLLYDSFAGIPDDLLNDGWPNPYADSPELHRRTQELFAPYPNIKVIKGRVPEVLLEESAEKIAFLHVDLNSAKAECAALDLLYDRLSPGAAIVFDDFGWAGARQQFDAISAWLAARGEEALELPTGQGLFIKPVRNGKS
jgi:O-methyltransferase